MNKDIENLKNVLVDLDDAENGAIINLSQEEIDSLKTILNLIENQQKEIEREKQYSNFYKDLCNKQQKLINQLLEDMKERANNFSYESEIMWRKIEKAEKLLEED